MTTPPPTTATATGSVYQQLRGHLHYLRLDAAAKALPATLDQAHTQQLSHTAFLERLLAIEVQATETRRHASHASRLRFAAFPAPWRLEDFDLDAQPGIDRKLVQELATL
jgi:DNA replication protein DnaC